MNSKYYKIIGELKSWTTGYISPSAQMAIKDGVELIEEMAEEINNLREENAKLKKNAGSRDVEF